MTMSKVTIVNVGFMVAWVNLKVFQWGGRKQENMSCHAFSFIVAKIKQSRMLTTHSTNCHCHILSFYTFVGQPFKTAVYIHALTAAT